jgi:hypothetical protein
MFALLPWSLARRAAHGRRAVLLLVLAALLYGFGMHAAKACPPKAIAALQEVAAAQGAPCHHGEVDLAQVACEVHCRTDTQSGRVLPSFDLPAAAPVDPVASLAPLLPAQITAPDTAPPRRDTGPPLHILLHRLLR